MISRYSFDIPLSLEELNTRVLMCQTPEETKRLGFLCLQHKTITLNRLIHALLFPVACYPDLNSIGFYLLESKITRLFPHSCSAIDQQALATFKGTIKRKLASQSPPFASSESVKPLTDEQKISQALTSTFTALNRGAPLYSPAVEKRLAQLLEESKADKFIEKATQLQIILNLLVVEEELMRRLFKAVDFSNQVQQTQLLFREECQQTLHLTRRKEALVFQLPETFASSEEFAFWIKINSLLNCRLQAQQCKLILQSPKKNPQVDSCIRMLEQKRMQIVEPRLQRLYDTVINCLRFSSIRKQSVQATKEILLFSQNIYTSAFAMQCQSTLSCLVTPGVYLFFKLIYEILSKQQMTLKNFSELQTMINFWATHRLQQKNLFEHTYQELKTLIHSTSHPTKFIHFIKSLLPTQNEKEMIPIQLYTVPPLSSLEQFLQPYAFSQPVIVSNSNSSSNGSSKVKKSKRKKASNSSQAKALTSDPLTDLESSINSKPSETLSPCPNFNFPLSSLPFPYLFASSINRWYHHPFNTPLCTDKFLEFVEEPLETSPSSSISCFRSFS